MQKYAPNAGYFQFMWIDFCPQSFYGVYDYWGRAKAEGIGGGLRALEESNRPVGIFLQYKDEPEIMHVVNDLPQDLGECQAQWTVTDRKGGRAGSGAAKIRVGPDSHLYAVVFPQLNWHTEEWHLVELVLRGPDGRELARNLYRDPFHFPAHPQGHPQRMDHELGMRLWWASE
jgi:beta-mannosidase